MTCGNFVVKVLQSFSENILCMISILFNLLTLVFWSSIWSVMGAWKKYIHSAVVAVVFYKCHLEPVGWCVARVFFIFAPFLTISSSSCWEGDVEVPNYNFRDPCFMKDQFWSLCLREKYKIWIQIQLKSEYLFWMRKITTNYTF